MSLGCSITGVVSVVGPGIGPSHPTVGSLGSGVSLVAHQLLCHWLPACAAVRRACLVTLLFCIAHAVAVLRLIALCGTAWMRGLPLPDPLNVLMAGRHCSYFLSQWFGMMPIFKYC